MSQNALAEVRRALGIRERDIPAVMTVAQRTQAAVIAIDQKGNRVSLAATETAKTGDRIIVSGGRIIGRAEQPQVTVWIS